MYEQADDVEDMLSKDSLDAAVNFTLLSPVRLFLLVHYNVPVHYKVKM